MGTHNSVSKQQATKSYLNLSHHRTDLHLPVVPSRSTLLPLPSPTQLSIDTGNPPTSHRSNMSSQVTPEVLWAQRSSSSDPEKNYIYLTIGVPDVPPKSLKLDLKPTSLTFTGASDTKKTTYHLEMEFYAEIDVENSKTHHTPANIQMILRKKDLKEEYWPRLLKDPAKVHYLRTDFDKWVDEDEQNEAPEDDYMNQFGGGLGAGEEGGDDEEGEDDDEMPDLEEDKEEEGDAK